MPGRLQRAQKMGSRRYCKMGNEYPKGHSPKYWRKHPEALQRVKRGVAILGGSERSRQLTSSDTWTVLSVLASVLFAVIIPPLYLRIPLFVAVCYGLIRLAHTSHWVSGWSSWKRTIVGLLAASVCALVALPQFVSQWKLQQKIDQATNATESNAGRQPEVSFPGWSLHALISLHNEHKGHRQYIWDGGVKGKSRVSVYIAPEDILTLSVSDDYGEVFEARSPLGADSVPTDQPIYLTCEIGIGGTTARLRLLVNGKQVGISEFPRAVPFDLSHAPSPVIGSDLDHANGGTFELYHLALYNRTLTALEMKKTALAFKSNHPAVRYNPPA